ncbi:MAG: efflux RND transporter periplasmic adaptor subunit [Burkholderiaceae bacterium]|jgi:Cu(I)/Ag(I) efflux system membrane fusion protein|nr:efflux RND transporter periplasmic adaptor subunit [Burkholderiaceae bacterium]
MNARISRTGETSTFFIKAAALVVIVALAGGAGGYWIARHAESGNAPSASSAPDKAPDGQRKVLYWYDPMVPNQHFDKPGKSPFMDMALVPRYADETDSATSVKIDSSITQNLGVRTTLVEQGKLVSGIDAVASVQFNNRQVAIVHARSNGFVERVYARAPGDVIKRGAPLVDVLMPEWLGAQSEFVEILKTGYSTLIQAGRDRLRAFGMSADLIRRIEQSRKPQTLVTISSPISGLIQSLDVRTGMTVSAGAPLARINGLDTVWVEAAIPESSAGQIRTGGKMRVSLAAYPGEQFSGRVLAVLPEANAESRTLRVRGELPNRKGRIRPGMYAQIHMDTPGSTQSVLLVPSEAIIRTGSRNLVLLALEGGRFKPAEVRLGKESNGKTTVLEGLAAGQSIVVSGQFLIDSEANLKGVLARLNPPDKPAVKTGLNTARGKVESLKGDEIMISHEAIPSIGWGEMTMLFKLSNPESGASLKPGDPVDFQFYEKNGEFVIVHINRRTP